MSNDVTSMPQEVVTWLGLFGTVPESPQTINLQEFMKEDNLAAFKSRYEKVSLRRDDILKYPLDYCSDDIQEIRRKIEEADNKVKLLGEPKTAEEAEKAIQAVDALEKEIENGAPKFRAHDKEVRKYFAELKKLKPRIQLADSLPATGTGGDSPWKAERLTYDTQKLKVIDEQNKKEFKKGNEELTKLATSIDKLVDKKLAQVTTQVDEATGVDGSAVKCKKLVDTLANTPGLIAAMSADKQLKLLETLRTKIVNCKACGKGMTKAEFEGHGNKCVSDLTPACAPNKIDAAKRCTKCGAPSTGGNCAAKCKCTTKNAWYDCDCGENFKENSATCTACGNTGADVTLEGYFCDDCGKSWSGGSECKAVCGESGKEIDDIVNKDRNRPLLDARAKIMGKMKMDEKFVQFDKENRKKIAKELREFKDFNDAEQSWAEWVSKGELVKIQTVLEKLIEKQCKILGHDTYPGHVGPTITLVLTDPTSDPKMKPSNYGYCEAGFPTKIKINKAHAGFNDFKEVVDTIIHENSHAWQEMVMKKLKGAAPYTGVDKKSIEDNTDLITQAKMFLENDETYIQSDVDGEAYRHEPVEEHAWNAGGATSAMLLVPPAVQSMKSSELMKSKTFFMKSIKRQADATIVTKERHGIYGSEWEGEEATDKVLYLEYLERPSGTAAVLRKVTVKIIDVVNEFTLETDFDATKMATPLIDPAKINAELKSKALQLFTKELASLDPGQLDQIHNLLVSEKKYQKTLDEGGKVVFREPDTHEFAELTGCRLMLDETVAKLT